MYILKNAYKSITRSRGRNILMGIVICVIGIASTLGLTINNASQEVVNNQKESSEVLVTFSIDRQSLRQVIVIRGQGVIGENISSDKIKEYMDSQFVKELRTRSTIGLNGSNIKAVSSEDFIENNTQTNNSNNQGRIQMGMGRMPNLFSRSDFEIIGYNTTSAMSEFINGTYKVIDGEMIDTESEVYECIINSDVAEENELSVGSNIILVNPNNENETYELLVKGIYEDNTESENMNNLFSNSANKIIVSQLLLDKIVMISNENEDTKLNVNISNTIVLNSIDNIDAFKKEVETKGLPENYEIVTNEASVNEALKPIQNLTDFTKVFLVIVLLIGAVILIILNMINIRERKYEIGVLRSIGMKKTFVLSQFVIELFIVTIIAISVGTLIGSILSVPAADYMLKNEIESIKAQNTNINNNFGRELYGSPRIGSGMQNLITNNSDIKYIEKIDSVVNFKIISQLLLISLFLTVISSSISMIAISRYNPLKILSNRS